MPKPELTETWHRGDWMQTFTGRQFFPLEPRVEDIDILDIAHALSMQCRYNGHVQRFYSVAEHCVLLSHAVDRELALWALLHDAPEAYIGDMVRPLKINMPDFRAADDHIMAVIAEKYGLAGVEIPPAVKDADTRILLNERDALLSAPPRPWAVHGAPLNVTIQAWAPARAEREYLNRFVQLTQEAA